MGQWVEKKMRKKTTERAMGVGRRTGDNTVESTNSSEIPDREETSDIPGLLEGQIRVKIRQQYLRL